MFWLKILSFLIPNTSGKGLTIAEITHLNLLTLRWGPLLPPDGKSLLIKTFNRSNETCIAELLSYIRNTYISSIRSIQWQHFVFALNAVTQMKRSAEFRSAVIIQSGIQLVHTLIWNETPAGLMTSHHPQPYVKNYFAMLAWWNQNSKHSKQNCLNISIFTWSLQHISKQNLAFSSKHRCVLLWPQNHFPFRTKRKNVFMAL